MLDLSHSAHGASIIARRFCENRGIAGRTGCARFLSGPCPRGPLPVSPS